jgi:hypothetical protein
MVTLPITASDDPQFIDLAAHAINGYAARVSSEFLHLVRIDAWFGRCWFEFAGKAVGALGVHSHDLKVPPFHPHRVMSEDRYRLSDPPEQVHGYQRLHRFRPSQSNLKNAIAQYGRSTTFAWYSGGSLASGRGAVMVYANTEHGSIGWYAGLVRREGWDLATAGGGPPRWDLITLVGIDNCTWGALLDHTTAQPAPA